MNVDAANREPAAARRAPPTPGGAGPGKHPQRWRCGLPAGTLPRVNIVHINTELRVAWRRGLEDGLAKRPDEVVPYKILPAAVDAVKEVASSRLKLFSEGGKMALPG